jgi:hypothetical protein
MFPLTLGEDYGKFPASDGLVICRSNTIVALALDRHNGNGSDDMGSPWRVLVLANGRYFEKRTELFLVFSGQFAGYEAFLKIFLDELTDSRRKMRHLYDQIMDLTKPKVGQDTSLLPRKLLKYSYLRLNNIYRITLFSMNQFGMISLETPA